MTIPRLSDRETHLRDHLRVLRKHRWLALAIFVVVSATGTLYIYGQVPVYQATTTVLIDPEPPRVLNIQEVTPIGSPTQDYYQTQYEIIRSRPVVERVVTTLNLRQRMPDLAGSTDPYGALAGSIRVEPKRSTRLVLVRFEHPDPAIAADIANGIATAYIKYNLDLKLKGSHDALGWLQDQMAELKAKVQQSSQALQNYRVKAGILGIQEQRQITAQKIMDFNKAYLESQAYRLGVEAKLGQLNQIATDRSGAQTIYTVADNALIQKLKSEASDLEVQRSKALKTYKEKHPEVLKIDAQIQQVQQKIDGEIQTMLRAVQTEYKVAKAREDTLLSNVNQLRREGQDLNEKEIQYVSLQRDLETNQQMYEAVLKRVKETGVTGGLESNNVRVVDEARPPRAPIRPQKTRGIVLSVVVGLVLGVAVAGVLEYFDTTLKSPDDVERVLGLPVIGVVPTYSVKR
jgi:uncharacterized protein involved in exopolysaccharide biosynthesis